ncbi:MAG: hypothetical protein JKY66_07660, partial [Spongiibacteraceae bacterium]|nr:hypothetical protein [Spongiibacteraceae bacterium]
MNDFTPRIENDVQQQDLILLKVYTIYRTVLSFAILLTFIVTPSAHLVGSLKPVLFIYVTSTYLAVNLIILFIVLPKKTSLSNPLLFANFIFDIVAIIFIADTTGGITSGLGILLVVSIAASSIILKNQQATLIAALASIALIIDTARLISQHHLNTSSFLHTGLLGIILFITTFFVQNLARRIRQAQLIAEQSTADLNVSQHLNQLIVQRMRTGILVADSNGKIQMNNVAAAELLDSMGEKNRSEQHTLLTLPPDLLEQFKQWLKFPQYQTLPFRTTQTGPELQASFSPLTKDVRN